ncbi:hypothetical protein ACFZC5_16530 [Nocardia gamkensis]|uniref:hypothetical protein n=1 Tax=Nocardia gamkensis TaxID=352869 RepID=UPI0036F0942A
MTQRSLELSRYDAAGVLELADELRAVYLDAHREQQDNPWYSPARFGERLQEIYLPIVGFELLAAWVDGRMIGYAFGRPTVDRRRCGRKQFGSFRTLLWFRRSR